MKLVLVIVFNIINSFSTKAQNDTLSYSFFVAGHTYGAAGVNNIGFHPPFKNIFGYLQNRTEIKFGVLTGDIAAPYPNAQDWDEIDADIDTLGLPVYFAVGNHDIINRSLYESRYGNTYYAFTFNRDLFIVLDPNLDNWNISGPQLQFLHNITDSLAACSDNIYVFFHQILWVEADNSFNYIHWNSDAGRANSINFWLEVEPIFRNLPNKTIFFAGDLGTPWSSDVSYDSYDNITLIASGMGDADGENIIVVNIDNNKSVDYDLICLTDSNLNCLGKLTDHQVVDIATMITDAKEQSLYIYPNPVTDFITVQYKPTGQATFSLYDMFGQLVLESKLVENFQNKIDVQAILRGFYIVRIVDDLNDLTVKIKVN